MASIAHGRDLFKRQLREEGGKQNGGRYFWLTCGVANSR